MLISNYYYDINIMIIIIIVNITEPGPSTIIITTFIIFNIIIFIIFVILLVFSLSSLLSLLSPYCYFTNPFAPVCSAVSECNQDRSDTHNRD